MAVDTVVQDIYNLLDKGFEVSEDEADAFGARMAEMLKTRLRKREDKPTLRFSNIGKPDLELWLTIKGFQGEQPSPAARMKFLYGDIIEELLLTLAHLSGHEVRDRQKQVSIDGIKGHMDATIDGEVVDVKSASSWGFKKFQEKNLGADSFGYIMQISAYAQANGNTRGTFLAMDKSTGELCLMGVPEDKMINVSNRIAHLKKILESDTPPNPACTIKREENGNEYLGSPCSYCPQKRNCHPNLRVFKYAEPIGNRYFTKMVKEPRVKEIALAGSTEITNAIQQGADEPVL